MLKFLSGLGVLGGGICRPLRGDGAKRRSEGATPMRSPHGLFRLRNSKGKVSSRARVAADRRSNLTEATHVTLFDCR